MPLTPGRHGVIAIHGIGSDHRRGDILARVVNGVADSLHESSSNGQRAVIRRTMDVSASPVTAELDITSPDGTQRSTWVFKEAFWADAFPPPQAGFVLGWLFKQGKQQLDNISDGLRNDPANNCPDVPEKLEPDRWTADWWLALTYRIELLLMAVLLTPLAFLVPAISAVLWPIYWAPRIGPIGTIIDWVHSLDPFLSRSVGDVQRFLEHGTWSAAARGELERVLIGMLEAVDEDAVDDITIVAHSMGCTVSYDALSDGGRVAQAMRQLKARGISKKITLVTVGSALNPTFTMSRTSNLYAREKFSQPLACEVTGFEPGSTLDGQALRNQFMWLDLYSRLDPVPAGDVDEWITTQARIHPTQIKRRRVINLDNPAMDHNHYFVNRDLVMPRITRAINGGEDYPWAEAGITEEKVQHRVKKIAILSGLRLGLGVITVGSLVIAGLTWTGIIFPGFSPWFPLIAAALAVGVYRTIRASMFGELS